MDKKWSWDDELHIAINCSRRWLLRYNYIGQLLVQCSTSVSCTVRNVKNGWGPDMILNYFKIKFHFDTTWKFARKPQFFYCFREGWKWNIGLKWVKISSVNPLSANSTKWSNTFKQFIGKLRAICLSVFNHFVGLALKALILLKTNQTIYSTYIISTIRYLNL